MQTESEIIEILKGEFTLQVKNFKKYNPGSTKQFIRLDNDWFQDLYVRDWPVDTRYVYVFLLSLIGRNDGGPCLCDVRKLSLNCHYRADRLSKALVRLWKDGFIFIEKRRKEKKRGDRVNLKKSPKQNNPITHPKRVKKMSVSRSSFSFLEEQTQQLLIKLNVTQFTVAQWLENNSPERLDRLIPTAYQKFMEGRANNPERFANSKFSNFFEGFMKRHKPRKNESAFIASEEELIRVRKLLKGEDPDAVG